MSRTIACLLVGVLVLPAGAHAASWSLGAQMGAMTIHSGAAAGASTVFGLPSNVFSYQPAFRLGYGTSRHSREGTLEGGAVVIDESGTTVTLAVAMFGYQHVLRPMARWSPYANASAGVLHEGGSGRSGNTPTFGGGAGMRRVLRDDRGALRMEARVDFLRAGGPFARPNLTTYGLRIGFDLWL